MVTETVTQTVLQEVTTTVVVLLDGHTKSTCTTDFEGTPSLSTTRSVDEDPCGIGYLEGTKAEHTAISFRVPRIEPTVAALKARGVTFADYDFPGLKTVEHVCVLGSEKAAWFTDTEGNILCLHEDLG